MSGIFICYRRVDSAVYAERLFDKLTSRFGGDSVSMDVDIPPDGDFRRAIKESVGACDVLLAVIGKSWLTTLHGAGSGSLTDPDDFVRLEIATALASDLRVIPVLVSGASMPHFSDLPSDLAGLARRQAVELTDFGWHSDVDRLIAGIETVLPGKRPAAPKPRSGFLDLLKKAGLTDPDRVRKELTIQQEASAGLTPAATPVAHASSTSTLPAPYAVFISYAFEDQGPAHKAVQAIEASGRKCWIAPRDIPPGTSSYARAIVKAIKLSRLMVVVVSEHSNQSDDVLNEVTLAKNSNVPRLPYRIDNSPLDDGLEYFFSQSQWLDAATIGREEAVVALVEAVASQVG